ncbi:hypothetical protein [Streptomyces sp. NPDC101149]|uniref:hypothetical protein n=1 Tax=Streptomyces sp. NPDC101149 TaxID=3366113 RepID=UPI00382D44C6
MAQAFRELGVEKEGERSGGATRTGGTGPAAVDGAGSGGPAVSAPRAGSAVSAAGVPGAPRYMWVRGNPAAGAPSSAADVGFRTQSGIIGADGRRTRRAAGAARRMPASAGTSFGITAG